MAFPNFSTGDILYVTGEAENLYGNDADKVMPHTKLVTRIWITGYILVEAGLNLISTKSQLSPYSPPIRYLSSELSKFGKVSQDNRQGISLVSVKREARNISTFTFELHENASVKIFPGQHAILDFSTENVKEYRHMADDNPQSLNDDYIRSWTISSIPEISSNGEYLPTTKFSCTIKNKYGGAISPLLHRWAKGRHQEKLVIKFIGVEGAFSCFDERYQLKYNNLLFIAGGVGITPFLSMVKVLRQREMMADVVFLFSARGEEVNLSKGFQEAGIKAVVFDTETVDRAGSEIKTINRRIRYEDIAQIPHLKERGVYLCGPEGFMAVVREYLENAGVQSANVNVESFAF